MKTIAINNFKKAVREMAKNPTVEGAMWQTGKAEILLERYGLTWKEIQAIEVEVLRNVNKERHMA